ncbi:hypothetical protein ACJIZ3_000333 [Penstemon smallii]|uniref:Phytocyanin domain-containing protein n=1 Tax=Penstemon smallii TaxID=265156 RepID=A0ABD3R8A1_9LAMI
MTDDHQCFHFCIKSQKRDFHFGIRSQMALPKALIPCLARVLLLSMICSFSGAREFVIDGNNSWELLNIWAQKNRFEIGDSIVLKYDAKTKSVLEVSEENYKICNKLNPIKSHNDGNTKIALEKSGPVFLINGAEDRCEKGEKLEIKVLSTKRGHHHVAPAPSPVENHHHHITPAPVPVPYPAENHLHLAPAPAPANGGSPMKGGFMGTFALLGIWALF